VADPWTVLLRMFCVTQGVGSRSCCARPGLRPTNVEEGGRDDSDNGRPGFAAYHPCGVDS
jgi:hypothetical protein